MTQQESPDVTVLAPAITTEPVKPPHLEVTQETALVRQVDAIVDRVSRDPRAIAAEVGNLGAREQQVASQKVDLLRTKVGRLLKEAESGGGQIPRDLIRMRELADQINPNVVGQPGWLSKLLRRTPSIGDKIAQIAVRYESVQTQIDAIMAGLRSGKDQLLMDNADLEILYQQVLDSQRRVQEVAYTGEILLQRLQEMLDAETDQAKRRQIEAVMHRVATRVQDMRLMEQVNLQFFGSIDITKDNNQTLADQVDRTATVVQGLLTVGIAIQAALANQRRTMEVVKGTQDYAADLLKGNAAGLRQQTAEISAMQNNPVIALDAVRTAHADLIAAMDETERVRREGITSSRAAIEEFTKMSANLQPRVDALRAAQQTTGMLSETTEG